MVKTNVESGKTTVPNMSILRRGSSEKKSKKLSTNKKKKNAGSTLSPEYQTDGLVDTIQKILQAIALILQLIKTIENKSLFQYNFIIRFSNKVLS